MRPRPIAALVLAGCGAGVLSTRLEPFASSYPDNIQGDLERTLERATADVPPERAAILVAAVPGRAEVIGYDLAAGRRLWTAPYTTDARPIVSQGLVIFPAGDEVVALSTEDGSLRFEVDREGRDFRGAAVCPSTKQIYVTLGQTNSAELDEDAGRSVLVAVSASGSTLWRHEVDRLVGAPAAVGGLVLVPWDQQYLSALDGANGHEVTRIRTSDDVISFVEAGPSGVYYGGTSVYRLTTKSASGTKNGSDRLEPVLGELPGDARVGPDTYAARPTRGARDRIGFHWRPASAEGGAVRLLNDALYFQYFRYLFAFETDGSLRWVHRHERDLVTAYAVEGGVVVAAEDGGLALLEADTGLVAWTGSVGSPIEVAALDASGFVPERRPTGEDPGLRARLLELAFDTDNRMVPARQLAVRRLAAIEDAAITGDLIEIAARRSVAAGVRATAGQMLLDRTSGASELLAALGRHYSFLDGVDAPPVGVIARAAARMQARDAVPALLTHLEDHETESIALPHVVAAIKTLGDASALPGLVEFLTRYHADDVLGEQTSALVVAVEAIGAWGDESDAQDLTRMAEDPFTLAALLGPLRSAISDIMARVHPPDSVDTTPDEDPDEVVDVPAAPEVPRLLDMVAVNQVLGQHDTAMRRCAYDHRGRGAPPARLRISFMLTNTGRISNITLTPTNDAMLACVKPLVEESVFPTFLEPRQSINFTFQVRP